MGGGGEEEGRGQYSSGLKIGDTHSVLFVAFFAFPCSWLALSLQTTRFTE